MEELQLDQQDYNEPISCLFFDGRKDETKTVVHVEGSAKVFPREVKEEHISVCSEPGSEYVCHFTPEPATSSTPAAMQVAIGLVDWMKRHGVDKTIQAVGADSTNMNTGRKGGTITFVEKLLDRKLTWLICSLHTGELPLRHLIQQLDRPTNSDHTFSGPLGRALHGVGNPYGYGYGVDFGWIWIFFSEKFGVEWVMG